MDMNLSTLQEMVKDRETQHAAVHGVTKSQKEHNHWKKTTIRNLKVLLSCFLATDIAIENIYII